MKGKNLQNNNSRTHQLFGFSMRMHIKIEYAAEPKWSNKSNREKKMYTRPNEINTWPLPDANTTLPAK